MAVKPRIMMISTHGYVAAEPEFGLPDTGGQVVYVLELSKCLARMGYSVDIYTRRFENQPQMEKVSDRVRLIRARCGGKDFIAKEHLWEFIPEWVTNVANFVRSKGLRYEFINSHYWDAGLAGQALANHFEIPHLHTPHSIGSWKRDNMDDTPEDAERKYNFTKRIREELMVYQECDAIIATTPQQRDILTSPDGDYNTRRNKIFTIPPGYDDTRFFPVSKASREALKRDAGLKGPIVLAIGRMAHNKGYDLLLRSMPVVFSRIDNAQLLLAVGSTTPSTREKEQIAELKDLAKELGIADRVVFSDYIGDDDLANYYRMADIFALSSRYEPFGMTAVEAMACGTPTIITTEGGLWEQVIWGLEALCANPFDPESYGHAIHFVLANPRLATQLAKRGSEKARGRFTWTGIAQQLLNATHNLAPRGKRGLAGVDDPAHDIVTEATIRDAQMMS